MVTCGDMGTDPDTLERRLRETFLRAANWKAILLLDEADVFVAARDRQDLKRNALVSILLRHLEYSKGLLFMTTNRPDNLDKTLSSRIQLGLKLPDFKFDLQQEVWKGFMNGLEGLTDGKKDKLVEFIECSLPELDVTFRNLNGRQIRNCVSAALALAQGESNEASSGVNLEPRHIRNMLMLGKEFKIYMDSKSDSQVMRIGSRATRID